MSGFNKIDDLEPEVWRVWYLIYLLRVLKVQSARSENRQWLNNIRGLVHRRGR
jgi:hypothetical protein